MSQRRHAGSFKQFFLSFRFSENADDGRTDSVSEKWCKLIKACLAGYGHFTGYNDDPTGPKEIMSSWKLADEYVHAKTMRMLFEQRPGFEGPQWADVICKAAAICPLRMLDLISARGADPFAATNTKSALLCAAGRSTSTFAVVQSLVNAASDAAFGEFELKSALDASVSLSGRGDPLSTLLPMYETIEEISVSGSGAVVEWVISRLPQETCKDDRYSMCLKTAAAAGNYDVASSCDASRILNLLFSRNSALMVTEKMVKICRNPVSLQSLLSLERTGGQHGDFV